MTIDTTDMIREKIAESGGKGKPSNASMVPANAKIPTLYKALLHERAGIFRIRVDK